MSSFQFVSLPVPGLYTAQFGQGIATRVQRDVLYIAGQGSAENDTGSRIPLLDALTGSGTLVFTGADSPRGADLVDLVHRLTRQKQGWRLLWIGPSGEAHGLALTRWKADTPDPSAEGNPTLEAPTFRASVKTRCVLDPADNLTLTLDGGTQVTFQASAGPDPNADPDSDGGDRTLLPTLRFLSAASVTVPSGSAEVAVTTDGPLNLALYGPHSGSLRAEADLSEPLKAEMRFRHQQATVTASVFTAPVGPIGVAFNPAKPNDPDQTSIKLRPGTEVLDSGFQEGNGAPIGLLAAEGGGIGFLDDGSASAGSRRFHPVPAGRFFPTRPSNLVCGLAGFEFLDLDAESSLEFVPEPSPDNQQPPAVWLSVGPPGAAYYSQSRDNGFYSGLDSSFMAALPVSAADLRPGTSIPCLPLGNPLSVAASSTGRPLSPSRAEPIIADLEATLMAMRADIILSRGAGTGVEPIRNSDPAEPKSTDPAPTDPAPTDAAPTDTAFTSGGFAAVLIDGAVRQLSLATVDQSSLVIDVDGTKGFRAALGLGDQFLVMTTPPGFVGEPGQHDQLVIDGWTLDVSPDTWSRNGTFLVLKQVIGRSLREMAADVDAWAFPTTFNDRPSVAAEQINSWINDATGSGAAEKLRLITDIVDNPMWQGVLLARVPSPASDLPSELSFLGDALGSGANLLAHHLILEGQRPGVGRGGDEDPIDEDRPGSNTVVSGLLEFPTPNIKSGPGRRGDGYSIAVRSLEVVLARSAIASFAAEVDMTGRDFLTTRLSEPQTITVSGRERRRAGSVYYDFGTTFEPPLDLQATDVVVERFRLTRADLDVAGFTFDGEIVFNPRSEVEPDILGYHSLTFSNLKLNVADGAEVDRITATWNPDHTEPDAEPIDTSLPADFPLRPSGLIVGSDNLSSLGFQPVILPAEVDVGPLGKSWIGIEWLIDLGSMGGLSSVSGFNASMALCWTPDQDRRQFGLGLRFPGFDVAGYGFSLQDMVDLTTHAVRLDANPFELGLKGIALELLGVELPWSGTIDLDLTPIVDGGPPTLGWYGRYLGETSDDDNDNDNDSARSVSGPSPGPGSSVTRRPPIKRSTTRSVNNVR